MSLQTVCLSVRLSVGQVVLFVPVLWPGPDTWVLLLLPERSQVWKRHFYLFFS